MRQNPAKSPRLIPHASRLLSLVATLCVALLACGCASTAGDKPEIAVHIAGARVLAMPADIEVSRLVLSGLQEPDPLWSQQSIADATTALRTELGARGAQFTALTDEALVRSPRLRQLNLLHQQVAKAIINHHLGEQRLEAKQGTMDWTLGRSDIGRAPDYLVFLYLRDAYATSGRDLFQVLTPGQQPDQIGYLSLVDVQTGRIVWFRTTQGGAKDLRKPSQMRAVVASLLAGLPTP